MHKRVKKTLEHCMVDFPAILTKQLPYWGEQNNNSNKITEMSFLLQKLQSVGLNITFFFIKQLQDPCDFKQNLWSYILLNAAVLIGSN